MTTLEASALLSELNGRGVAIDATPDGSLRCKPKNAITEEDVERIKFNKGELLALLSTTSTGENLSSPIVPIVLTTTKGDIYRNRRGDDRGDDTEESTVPLFVQAEQERRAGAAGALGLVSRWSHEFGYVSIHDPTSGEWHDLLTDEPPGWAKREASERKRLRRFEGVTRLLTSREIEARWLGERGLRTDRDEQAMSKGLIYGDYLDDGED